MADSEPPDPRHAAEVEALRRLVETGADLLARGRHDELEALCRQALAPAAGGPPDLLAASAYNFLGESYEARGLRDLAADSWRRALSCAERAYGPASVVAGILLGTLGDLELQRGNEDAAEALLLRARDLAVRAPGGDDVDLARSASRLGRLYLAQGAYERAEQTLLPALRDRERTAGPGDPMVGVLLHNLASVYLWQQRLDEALPLARRAVALAGLGPTADRGGLAERLTTLAQLYRLHGDGGAARPLLEQVLKLREAEAGPAHPGAALARWNLATLLAEQGHLDEAAAAYEGALGTLEEAWGPEHPDVARALHGLAAVRLAQGRPAAALPLFGRALRITETHLRRCRLGVPAARLDRLCEKLFREEHVLCSLPRAAPEDPAARLLVLTHVLLRKGRAADEVAAAARAWRESPVPEEAARLGELRALRGELASLALAGRGALSPAAYQQALADRTARAEVLEQALVRDAALRPPLPAPADIVGEVATALPPDAVLVELLHHWPHRLGASSSGPWDPPRYLALVLLPAGAVTCVDLGEAAPIHEAATALRGALRDPASDPLAPARRLHDLLLLPLLPALGGRRRVFVSPDGPLHLVPLAALHDGSAYALDTYELVYLTSGRDLLARSAAQGVPAAAEGRGGATSVVVLADPAFGAPPAGPAGAPGDRALLGRTHAPLPGTRQEAQAISALLPSARLLLGEEATEAALLGLVRPGLLHVATHGHFLEDGPPAPPGRGFVTAAPAPPDPLLRAALALAGADLPVEPGRPDGLVTALELAGLDLAGTQLVVLSACGTGLGEVRFSQGVAGLRRAVMAAGAETLVVSLWSVSDSATRDLMARYYQALLRGEGRAAALSAAARDLRKTAPHPFHWAPFIVIGRPGPLRSV